MALVRARSGLGYRESLSTSPNENGLLADVNCAVPVLRLRRARLLRFAVKVFGDEARARDWVRTPQPALEGAIPDELADTLEGLERALSELESLSA